MELSHSLPGASFAPKNWQFKRLGELAAFVTSGSRGWARFYAQAGALFIRSQNVRDGRLRFDDVQYVSPPAGAEGDRTKVKRHDLLITITGNSVGNVALVEEDFAEAYISQHVGLVRLKEPAAAPYICRYLSPFSPGNAQIFLSQSGQSKPGLKLQNLRDLSIASPSTAREQHAIAEALGDVDALLGGLDRLIAKKRDLKQATMQQLLPGQTRLAGFSGEPEITTFSQVVRHHAGNSALIKGKLLSSGASSLYPAFSASGQDVWREHFEHEGEAIVVSAVGSRCGKAFKAAGKWSAIANTHVVWPDRTKINIRYLELFINDENFWLKSGTGQPFVLFKQTFSRPLLLPSITEQAAIADIVSDMDAELGVIRARRAKTAAVKQGMMQELLTGRTRLV